MESILCGVIAWNVIPRGNISRKGKHFIDLVFGKKMKVKNLRDIRMRIWLILNWIILGKMLC